MYDPRMTWVEFRLRLWFALGGRPARIILGTRPFYGPCSGHVASLQTVLYLDACPASQVRQCFVSANGHGILASVAWAKEVETLRRVRQSARNASLQETTWADLREPSVHNVSLFLFGRFRNQLRRPIINPFRDNFLSRAEKLKYKMDV
jgi:hypothetical protein